LDSELHRLEVTRMIFCAQSIIDKETNMQSPGSEPNLTDLEWST